MDYKKLSDDELIELCKEKSIEYFNAKTKKNYARTTLITKIKKLDIDKEIETPKDEITKDEIINIEYKNEIIWTLSDEDKKNNDDYKDIESKLRSCIRCCHNYLYSNGSIVGNEASNDIILLFILKVLNYLYISNKDIIIDKIQSLTDNKDYNKYLEILDNINNLKKISDGNDINSQYEDYMDDVVRGKLLPLIFTEDKDFSLNTKSEENNIIKIINEFDKIIIDDITIKAFSTISIYEYFNSGYEGKSKNKKLGQFFTPKKVINSILYGCQFKNMVDEFENPSIYDPCCGTAGLLCVLYNSCSNINIDNIYGCEISKDTIKFAIASLMLSTNSLFENLNKGCALSNNKYIFDNKKFDVIFTNPPFGTSLKYKELKSKFDKNKPDNFNIKFEDIYPFEYNNGVNLFIMNIIHSLNDNGICAVIVPDGELITSKSLFYMRKYIIDNCKMLKIIAVESKAFEYTSIKTNVLIFKKQNGEDNYKNVEFLEINKDCNQVKLIAVADLDKYYTFKLETNNNDIIDYELNKDIEIIKFGEMFDLIKGSIQSSKVIEDPNGITLVTGAKEFKTIKIISDVSILSDKNLFISTNGNGDKIPIKYYDKDCYYSCLMSLCKIKNNYNDKINIRYIYYYLLEKQIYIEENYQKGLGQKSLDVEKFNLMDMLIPSIEKQEEIVKYLDKLDNKNTLFEYSNNKLFELLLNKSDIYDRIELFNNIENTNIDINNNINKLNELNNYKLKIAKYNPTSEIKTLGEIASINIGGTPKRDNLLYYNNGTNQWVSIRELNNNIIYDTKEKITDLGVKNSNVKLLPINTILFAFKLSIGKIGIAGVPLYTNEEIAGINTNNDTIINKYLYYYLYYTDFKHLASGLIGTCGSLNKKILEELKIPIPSLEVQKEIIEYCDNNLDIINNLKKTIENNKIMMKELFL
jgi:type I restriction-modification system DNA methylase subunit/restriction endonuclease S subunit